MSEVFFSLVTRLTVSISFLLAGGLLGKEPIPTLHFPEGISWKGVFDAGFRPKHLVGLERDRCVVNGLQFYFKLGEKDPFLLDAGRISFELMADERVRIFWHQEDNPITMQEGRRRLDDFYGLIKDGEKVYEGRLPPVVDRATMQIDPDYRWDTSANFGEYTLIYGFDASFNREKPLIPHFYITYSPPGMPDFPIRRHTVEPPEGYEWYSLDPNVDTPDPGSEVGDEAEGENDGLEAVDLPRAQQDRTPAGSQTVEMPPNRPVGLIVALGLLLATVGIVVRGKLRRGAS